MNYRHHFHAGNFADVMKHALLVVLARALQRKPKGVLFLDTHAGRGRYDLERARSGDTLERTPEHPEGIGRLWNETDLPPALADYVALVRAFDSQAAARPSGAEPRFYPGSPALLRRIVRPQDRISLWEKHPEEAAALRSEFSGLSRVSVQEGDGYSSLKADLPPPERRALILVDPPYEDRDEWVRIGTALETGLRRFPSGVYAIWYPLTARSEAEGGGERLRSLKLPPTLAAELTIDPTSEGMKGCGLLVVNPPWGFEEEAKPVLDALAGRLGRTAGATADVRWLVPE